VSRRATANRLQTNRVEQAGRIGTSGARFGSTTALAGHVGTGWTPVGVTLDQVVKVRVLARSLKNSNKEGSKGPHVSGVSVSMFRTDQPELSGRKAPGRSGEVWNAYTERTTRRPSPQPITDLRSVVATITSEERPVLARAQTVFDVSAVRRRADLTECLGNSEAVAHTVRCAADDVAAWSAAEC
jgi:hypothetical protein